MHSKEDRCGREQKRRQGGSHRYGKGGKRKQVTEADDGHGEDGNHRCAQRGARQIVRQTDPRKRQKTREGRLADGHGGKLLLIQSEKSGHGQKQYDSADHG